MKKIIFVLLLVLAILGILGIFGIFNPKTALRITPQNQTSTVNKQNITITPIPTATPAMQVISVTDNGFVPQKLVIKKGSTVTWTNNTKSAINISSDPYPLNNAYPPLNLGNFNSGESLSLTFDKTGTYSYHNHIIPPQKGTIVVQ